MISRPSKRPVGDVDVDPPADTPSMKVKNTDEVTQKDLEQSVRFTIELLRSDGARQAVQPA